MDKQLKDFPMQMLCYPSKVRIRYRLLLVRKPFASIDFSIWFPYEQVFLFLRTIGENRKQMTNIDIIIVFFLSHTCSLVVFFSIIHVLFSLRPILLYIGICKVWVLYIIILNVTAMVYAHKNKNGDLI